MRTHPTALGDSLWNHGPGKTYRWDSPACLVYLGTRKLRYRNRRLRVLSYPILRPWDLNLIVKGGETKSRGGMQNVYVRMATRVCHRLFAIPEAHVNVP